MSENNETVADIVAEFREMVHKSVDGIIAVKADVIADRLETAWKREKAEVEASALAAGGIVEASRHKHGNAAAAREAVEDVVRALSESNDVLSALLLMQAEAKCKAALAAPPRNCDRFNSGDATKDAADAYDEWQRHCNDPLMPPSCKVESAFKQWLFSVTPKQKGENDGK